MKYVGLPYGEPEQRRSQRRASAGHDAANRRMLDDLAALGPFFAVSSHPPGTGPGPPWRPIRELIEPDGPLAGRIDAVRAALAGRANRTAVQIEPRVAASVTHLGLAARLIAPAVAAAATGLPLAIRPGDVWWQDTLGGPVPLSVPVPPAAAAASDPPTARGLLDEMIAPLTAQISSLVTVSPQVLWGNVASAVNAAATQVAARRPDLSRPAWTVAATLFDSPQLSRERQPPGPAYRRASCCLVYKIAVGRPQGVCGDCVLRLFRASFCWAPDGGKHGGAGHGGPCCRAVVP